MTTNADLMNYLKTFPYELNERVDYFNVGTNSMYWGKITSITYLVSYFTKEKKVDVEIGLEIIDRDSDIQNIIVEVCQIYKKDSDKSKAWKIYNQL